VSPLVHDVDGIKGGFKPRHYRRMSKRQDPT